MQTFLELLARNAFGAALLAGVVLALMPIVRRPAVRNVLWLIVFARLLLPPLWSVPLLPSAATPADQPAQASLLERPAPREPVGEVAFVDADPPAGRPNHSGEMVVVEPAAQSRLSAQLPADPHDSPPRAGKIGLNATQRPTTGAAATGGYTLPNMLIPALFATWLTGCSIVVVLAIARIRRFECGLRDAVLAPNDVQDQSRRLARLMGLRRGPPVWLAPGRVPPLLWLSGLFARQARLILPLELFLRLDVEQRSALMAHELAHLRRGDPWVRWLELLAVAVYWWFPLLGFCRRQLRESEEQCCDGWVVALLSKRKAYATALLETVEYLDRPDLPAAPALASGASPVHNLQRRLTMIMSGSVRGRLTRFGALAALGVAVGALAFGPAFSRAQQDPPREKKHRPAKGEGEFQPRGEKDRVPPRGEGEFQPKGLKDRFQPREGGEELERARNELQKAREEAERAMKRVREIEERIQKLTGGRFGGPMGDRERSERKEDARGRPGPRGGGPMGPRDPMRDGQGIGPMGPGPNDGGFGRGPERQIQEVQRQLEEMRRMIEELRRELNRGPGGPDRRNPDGPGPKGQPDRDRKDFRPGGGPGGPGGAPRRPGGAPDGPGGRGGPEKAPQPPEKDN